MSWQGTLLWPCPVKHMYLPCIMPLKVSLSNLWSRQRKNRKLTLCPTWQSQEPINFCLHLRISCSNGGWELQTWINSNTYPKNLRILVDYRHELTPMLRQSSTELLASPNCREGNQSSYLTAWLAAHGKAYHVYCGAFWFKTVTTNGLRPSNNDTKIV